MRKINNICVYCGSSAGLAPMYAQKARAFGALLAKENIRLVYGGGDSGIMGALSQGARNAGGFVTAIIPQFLINKEALEKSLKLLDKVIITDDMHERKRLMYEQSDAFVALPGGLGTLEELVEQLTWAQLGHHEKPVVLFDVNGFWQPFCDLFHHMESQGFVHSKNKLNFQVVSKIEDIIPTLST